VFYESGARAPTVPTLERLLEAAGLRAEIRLMPARNRPDPKTSARWLAEVLELADHLPQRRPARELPYPPFRSLR
jgi:hypothetical protein